MSFALSVLFLTLCFALAGLAAGWFGNRLGLLSVAHGAIIGSGAYAFALSSRSWGASYAGLLAAIIAGSIVGWGVTVLSERVIGEEFALASFGLQVIWTTLVRNLTSVTGGPLGIAAVGSLGVWGMSSGAFSHCLLVACVAAVVVGMRASVARSSFVVAAAFVRRSRELAVTLGVPSLWIRSQVGLIYGACLGAIGCLLASFVTFVGPDDFTTETSVSILAIAFIMMRERFTAALLGAVVIIGVPQILRLLGVAAGRAGFAELFMSGIIVMGSQLLQRRGDVRP
jgi:branched-chain amino acid transport system permease protein